MRHALRSLQDRVSDPSLTLLLLVQVLVLFVIAPVLSAGIALPGPVWAAALCAVGLLAVIVSPRPGPTIVVLAAICVSSVGAWIRLTRDTHTTDWLGAAGNIMALSAVSWVIAQRVFAPGRMNVHRVVGAVSLYLNFAIFFTAVYRLIAELSPGSFSGMTAGFERTRSLGDLMYFSLATLTTVGYGDITPLNPAARSLANMEGVIGQLYPAIILARIVTLYEPKR